MAQTETNHQVILSHITTLKDSAEATRSACTGDSGSSAKHNLSMSRYTICSNLFLAKAMEDRAI